MASKWLIAVLSTLALFTLSASDARADSLSCNGRIVATGDSAYQVRAVCGDPDAVNRRVELRTARQRVLVPCGGQRCWAEVERSVEVTIEEWTYDFGRTRFMQFLLFEDGKLARIESGGYGHKSR